MKKLNAKQKKGLKKLIEIIKSCVCRGRKKPKSPRPKKQKSKKSENIL